LRLLQRRLPSGMQGDKTSAARGAFPSAAGSEGSLRNHLAVWGPGVPSGAVDDTLLTLADVLPTMAELANASNTKHKPWSGRSFASLLTEGGKRRRSLESRYHFVLAVAAEDNQCPPLMDLMLKQLPDLGPEGCAYWMRQQQSQIGKGLLTRVACLSCAACMYKRCCN
jgi:hypothetical protein